MAGPQVIYMLIACWMCAGHVISGDSVSRLEAAAERLESVADRLEVIAGIRSTTQATTTTTKATWSPSNSVEKYVPCDDDNVFTCDDGQCISNSRRCDTRYDCSNIEDEINCESCQGDLFLCPIEGKCLESSRRCDGNTECMRGYDEQDCGKRNNYSDCLDQDSCKPDAFYCSASRTCISKYSLCNMIDDCSDGADERYHCECALKCDAGLHPNHFTNSVGKGSNCLRQYDLCDGYADCADGQDELNCDCTDRFRCSDNVCISANGRCDGYKTCSDGADEQNCDVCHTEWAYRCSDGSCITRQAVCDGIPDCVTGDDEENCDSCNENAGMAIYCPADQKCGRQCDGKVDCSGGEDEAGCTDFQLRLVGGRSANEGRLEVLWQGQWGIVCDDYFSYEDIRVACRQLGYPGSNVKKFIPPAGTASRRVVLKGPECRGNETSLLHCLRQSPLGTADCLEGIHTSYAGVRCDPSND